jgi:hypothetical protein
MQKATQCSVVTTYIDKLAEAMREKSRYYNSIPLRPSYDSPTAAHAADEQGAV